jgi:hypothetical protein
VQAYDEAERRRTARTPRLAASAASDDDGSA